MTTLVRFDPYRQATALQGEMARFLTLFAGEAGTTAGVWAPAMDVWETNEEIVYAFDLLGSLRQRRARSPRQEACGRGAAPDPDRQRQGCDRHRQGPDRG